MGIIWDEKKNKWLKEKRYISFEVIAEIILNRKYLDILENPKYPGQMYFVMHLHKYTWIVPFLIDSEEKIVLKTAFPSRKFHKKYGESK